MIKVCVHWFLSQIKCLIARESIKTLQHSGFQWIFSWKWKHASFCRVRIKHKEIEKWDLLSCYHDKKYLFTIFCITELCAKHTHTHTHTHNTFEFHLYCWDHFCKVNEWCLVACFHHKFRVYTQIVVRNCCIAKWKKFFTGSIFFLQFKTFMLIRILFCNINCLTSHFASGFIGTGHLLFRRKYLVIFILVL